MRLLKNNYLVGTEERLKETGNLVLVEDRDKQEIWRVRVLKTSDQERDIRIGDVITVHKKALLSDLEDKNYFVKKQDIINVL